MSHIANYQYQFLRAKAATFVQLLLSAHLSHRNSVCLSVTRVDQSKRCKLESPNIHHRLPGRL